MLNNNLMLKILLNKIRELKSTVLNQNYKVNSFTYFHFFLLTFLIQNFTLLYVARFGNS